MIRKEDLERKFALKNKIVVYVPSGATTTLKKEKTYNYVITWPDRKFVTDDIKHLESYCHMFCLKRNKEPITPELVDETFKLRSSMIVHKPDMTPAKLSKEKDFRYIMDNGDTNVIFKDLEEVTETFNKYGFSL